MNLSLPKQWSIFCPVSHHFTYRSPFRVETTIQGTSLWSASSLMKSGYSVKAFEQYLHRSPMLIQRQGFSLKPSG